MENDNVKAFLQVLSLLKRHIIDLLQDFLMFILRKTKCLK